MVANTPTARVSERVQLLRIVAACDSTLKRLDGSQNPALLARMSSVRVTRANALLSLAEIRAAAGTNRRAAPQPSEPRAKRVPLAVRIAVTRLKGLSG